MGCAGTHPGLGSQHLQPGLSQWAAAGRGAGPDLAPEGLQGEPPRLGNGEDGRCSPEIGDLPSGYVKIAIENGH
jgi:hypothetical protein